MRQELTSKQIALEIKRNSAEVPSGCWEWQGTLFNVGYPVVPKAFGGGRYGHRAMFAAMVAPIPAGMYVLHTCDNRKCVNPAHLFLGTHIDNIKDMHSKGRQRGGSLSNEKNPNAKFTDEIIGRIRTDHANGKRYTVLMREYGISDGHLNRVLRKEARRG